MATTTTTPSYDNQKSRGGIYPTDSRTGVYTSYVADEGGLDVINDIVKTHLLAIGVRPAAIELEMGDHDAGSSAVHSLIVNDGTTSHEVAKSVTIGQAGGVARVGDGTAPARMPATLTAEGWIGVKTITAPGTLQTASRLVRVMAIIEAVT